MPVPVDLRTVIEVRMNMIFYNWLQKLDVGLMAGTRGRSRLRLYPIEKQEGIL